MRVDQPMVDPDTPILVAGAGGFIGGWFARDLARQGYRDVRCVDVKPLEEWFQIQPMYDNRVHDLQRFEECTQASHGRLAVFNFASDMGGMGFIELHKAECMLSVLINTHLLQAARISGVERFFFASSACVYKADKQTSVDVTALCEEDAYPAMPEDGYGWEKLFSERMVRHFSEDFGIEGRVARFHNIYGPHGTWDGGREKAPAAIARKVAKAVQSGEHKIEIWGDGEQRRSFTYIDDAVYGVQRLMWSDVSEPLNIGSDQLVSINQLVDIVEAVAGIQLARDYLLEAPKGVRGRNSDNSRIKELLGWAPSITLEEGMQVTYSWVAEQVAKDLAGT